MRVPSASFRATFQNGWRILAVLSGVEIHLGGFGCGGAAASSPCLDRRDAAPAEDALVTFGRLKERFLPASTCSRLRLAAG